MMMGKSESLYDSVFTQILQKLNTRIPGEITSVCLMISDFEFAILNFSKRDLPQGKAKVAVLVRYSEFL